MRRRMQMLRIDTSHKLNKSSKQWKYFLFPISDIIVVEWQIFSYERAGRWLAGWQVFSWTMHEVPMPCAKVCVGIYFHFVKGLIQFATGCHLQNRDDRLSLHHRRGRVCE